MHLAAFLYMLFWLPMLRAESTRELSSRWLDTLLQDYAFRSLVRPKTGVPYDGNAPSNLTGIKIAALRLRSGSLRRRGFSSYKELHIPVGVIEQPFVERLVFVYHNLANWSEFYYPLPGYTYLAPVIGLLAYNGSDLSANNNLSELDIRASTEPMRINFSYVQPAPEGLSPKCVYFDLYGSVEFDNVIDQNVCSTTKQGHYSIVVEFVTPMPVPAPAPAPGAGGSSGGGGGGKGKMETWIIVGSVAGGLVLFLFLLVILVWLKKCRHRKKIEMMEEAAEKGVPLQTTMVGNTKVPLALETRTRPLLENDYVVI